MGLLTFLADAVGLTQYRAWYWVPSKDGHGWDEACTEWYFSERALTIARQTQGWLPDSFSRIEVKNG